MFPTPWYQGTVAILKRHPDVSVGVHLTINSEWKNYRCGPVPGRSAAPPLVDADGYFFPTSEALHRHDPDLREVRRKLRPIRTPTFWSRPTSMAIRTTPPFPRTSGGTTAAENSANSGSSPSETRGDRAIVSMHLRCDLPRIYEVSKNFNEADQGRRLTTHARVIRVCAHETRLINT